MTLPEHHLDDPVPAHRGDPPSEQRAMARSAGIVDRSHRGIIAVSGEDRLELANGKFNGKPLIDADALAATHVPLMARGKNPVTGGNSFYGLGWNVEFGRHGLTWTHAGAFSQGAQTFATLYPDTQLGVVVLTNAFPTGAPEGLSDSFADLMFAGKVEKDWIAAWNAIYSGTFGPAIEAAAKTFGQKPDPATPALPSAAYAGTYGNAYVGEGTVKAEGAGLTLSVGPRVTRPFR